MKNKTKNKIVKPYLNTSQNQMSTKRTVYKKKVSSQMKKQNKIKKTLPQYQPNPKPLQKEPSTKKRLLVVK